MSTDSTERPKRIAASDRIPTFQKLCFAAGVNTDYVSTSLLVGTLWMPVFNIGFGISPVTLGVILMIFRFWDAITDPVMGNISDNAQTRWGRRRPFMFVGAILTALVYPFFWYMPHLWSESAKSVYLTVTGLVFFTTFTFWSMPYYGMQLELTPSYDERSRLTAWTAFFGKLFWLCAGWFMPLVMIIGHLALGEPTSLTGKGSFFLRYLEPLQPWLAALPGVEAGTKPIVAGMRIACWLVVVATLVFGLLPALFVKERYYKAVSKKQPREPFWRSIKESFSCGPLWILIGTSFLLSLGTSSVLTLGQYVNYYYVNHGDLTMGTVIGGWKTTTTVVVGLASLPLLVKLGERLDKRRITLIVLGLTIFGHALNYFCMTPRYPYLQIVSGVFEAYAMGAFWMFLPSMKADVADYDEFHTQRRREGSINAFYSWFLKVAGTLALGAGGLVLQFTGFDAKAASQPPEVLDRMFHLYLLLPIPLWILAIIIFWRYPLGRARAEQIREALEARRGTM